MRTDFDWDDVQARPESRLGSAGMGAVRVALLFGSAAIALALIVAPAAEKQFVRHTGGAGIDMMSTGSVARNDTYTVRRSVLQNSPESICIIHSSGRQSGDCR